MRHKIGVKLIAMVGMTVMVIIGIYAYINIQSQEEVLLKEVTRHGNQLSETVKNSTRQAMLEYHRNRIQETISNISQDPSLHEISIMNKEGQVVYSTTPGKIGKTMKVDTENCSVCHSEDRPLSELSIEQRTRVITAPQDSARALGITNPIYNERSCWEASCHAHDPNKKILGVLHILLCLKEVDAQIEKSKLWVALFAVVSILTISALIGFFVRRWIDRPVNYLLEAIRQVASGNLNYTIADMGNDELGSLAASFNNMTRKLAEARLQLFQSDKLASLGRLAAGVAHEINNPLTGVLTYSSFLQKRTKDQPEIQEDLKVIVSETLRSREIVKGLLDFARQSIPKKKKANINEIIDRAIRVVENQLQLKHIRIEKAYDHVLPDVTVDANQIQQVFINLLLNAADAIDQEKGVCEIRTRAISLSLHGMHQIKKATCPKNHSLIDEEIKIDGLAPIKLKALANGHQGYIYIDPIYGKHRNVYGAFDPKDKQVRLYCPECDVLLTDELKKCPECRSSVYTVNIPSMGHVEGCIRQGCSWQRWDEIDALGQIWYVEILVSDNGRGIPEKNLQKIFEPFYSTKGQSGTGLGLSVIWGILDNHSGTITVRSKVDEGTTFTVRLPVEPVV